MSENTIPELLEKRVKDHGTRLLFQRRDGWSWKQITWLDFDREVKNIASFLMDMGFGKGDRALVVSANTLEAIETEIAIYHLGGSVVPLSRNEGTERVKEVAKELGVKFIFVEDSGRLDDVTVALEDIPDVLRVAFFQNVKTRHERVLNFKSILKFGFMKRKKLYDELTQASKDIEPETPAALFYTPDGSGSKTIEITQKDILDALEHASCKIKEIGDEDQSFSYMSSVSPFTKFINYLTLYKGNRAATAETREDFYEDILEVKPTVVFETSEGLESFYKKSVSSLDGLTPVKRLKKDLGSRVKYIFTDSLPDPNIESLYRSSGVKFGVVPELNNMLIK